MTVLLLRAWRKNCNSFEVIRKTTEIVASGDADTQWRRIANPPNSAPTIQRNGGNEIGHQYWIRYGIINN